MYSVGVTGKFDGGEPAKKPEAKDTLFRYPAPVYLRQQQALCVSRLQQAGYLSGESGLLIPRAS